MLYAGVMTVCFILFFDFRLFNPPKMTFESTSPFLLKQPVFTEGEPTYPETVTISCTEGASERWPSVMGVYKITNITHSGRPVWQSTVREDRYLLYNGNKMIYMIANK